MKFTATFSGPGPITYQWQVASDGFSFNDIPGATNITYIINSFDPNDDGFAWQVLAHNQFGTTASFQVYTLLNSGVPKYLWSAPVPFAGLNSDQILTNFSGSHIAGALVAKVGGSQIMVTNSNGSVIAFAGSGAWASLSGGVGYSVGANTNNTGNANFNSCLNATYFDNATHTITMSGLVVGQQYQLQLFALDNRGTLTPPANQRSLFWEDPANDYDVSQVYTMADNAYMLGTFIASNSVETVSEILTTNGGNFNCLVLRAVGWTPPPYFVSAPVDVNAFSGGNVALTGSAAGDTAAGAISYQWAYGPTNGPYTNLVEGAKYAGVTTSTLTISNLVDADSQWVYVLKAQDTGGTTISREAQLHVQAPPILPPANSFASAALALTNNHLVGMWQLNETNDPSTGLLVAYDYSTNHHDGRYGNQAGNAYTGQLAPQPPTYGGFYTNQGALQTGATSNSNTNSLVYLPPLNTTNSPDMTICMWINPSANVGYAAGLLFTRSSTDQCGFGFSGGNNGGPSGQEALGFLWGQNGGQATYQYNSQLFPVNNIWNFVAMVIRTNGATFYLMYVDNNGAAYFGQATDPINLTQQRWGANPIWLGGDQYGDGAGRIFQGRISNLAFYNSALTTQQLQELFAVGFQTDGFPPAFATQPPATNANYTGFTVQIRAQTGGTAPITNQWVFNGAKLVDGWYNGTIVNGSTSNVLTIVNVTTNWDGVYNMTITNAFGGNISSNAVVNVLTPTAPPTGNIVGEWFAGAQNLNDVSGNNPGIHNGTQFMTNGVAQGTLTWSSDLPPVNSGGSSLAIANTGIIIDNTSTNDANYENTFDVGISNAMTVTFWAKGWPAGWSPWVAKYGETTPSPAGGWQLRVDGQNNTSPCWTIRGGGGTVTMGTGIYGNSEDLGATGLTYGNDGQWHFYCGTYDVSTGIRDLYVDGALAAQVTGQGQYATAPFSHLTIGTRDQGGTNGYSGAYTGLIYDVRIYNVAISGTDQASQVKAPPLPPLALGATATPASGGNPGQLVLTWLNGGLLLESPAVEGPWTTNTLATPPYTVLTTNSPAEFYKVLFP